MNRDVFIFLFINESVKKSNGCPNSYKKQKVPTSQDFLFFISMLMVCLPYTDHPFTGLFYQMDVNIFLILI